MGLFTRKDTGPRSVLCPNCGGGLEVAAAAQSVSCRHCNTSVKVADQKITQYAAMVTLETCGSIVVEKKGALVVQKRCIGSSLVVRGSLKGPAIVHGAATIEAGAQMIGDLSTRTLTIEEGATLKGFLRIAPAGETVLGETPKEIAGRPKAFA